MSAVYALSLCEVFSIKMWAELNRLDSYYIHYRGSLSMMFTFLFYFLSVSTITSIYFSLALLSSSYTMFILFLPSFSIHLTLLFFDAIAASLLRFSKSTIDIFLSYLLLDAIKIP